LSWDFGRSLQNRTLSKQFVVRNVGEKDLEIDRVSTTCGCTVASGYAKLLKPGETTTLEVRFSTQRFAGKVERKVLIRSNDEESDPLTLTVSALVVPE
jgi:hypothetical protein